MTDAHVSHAPRRRGRVVFLAVSATVVVALLMLAHDVLLPFVLALVVAYVLTPVVARVEWGGRVPRWAAILITYATTLGALGSCGWLIAPRIGREVAALRRELPPIVHAARDTWAHRLDEVARRFVGEPEPPAHADTDAERGAIRVVPRGEGAYDLELGAGIDVRPVGEGAYRVEPAVGGGGQPTSSTEHLFRHALGEAVAYGRSNVFTLLRLVQAAVATVWQFFFLFFVTLMLAGYIMLTRERIYEFFRSLCAPEARASFDALARRVDRGLSGIVRGQLVICGVNGILSAIGFYALGLKFWPLLALLAAVFSIIPIFGALLSSVPVIAIALTDSFGTALGAFAWIVGIHQLEANLLNPKIIGDAAKIHPVLVVFALLAGEHLFRLPGALLAVPCLSILQSLFLHFRAVLG